MHRNYHFLLYFIDIFIFSIIHLETIYLYDYLYICCLYNANKISIIHIIVLVIPIFSIIHLETIYLYDYLYICCLYNANKISIIHIIVCDTYLYTHT